MVKRLRENRKNKKGFTLVELIVVIVIILVLAAVMVPSVTKYIAKANQANCKSDAASILVQLQANVADHYSTDSTADVAYDFATKATKVGDATWSGSAVNAVTAGKKTYHAKETDGDITEFSYQNGKYWIQWTKTGDWTEPSKTGTSSTPTPGA